MSDRYKIRNRENLDAALTEIEDSFEITDNTKIKQDIVKKLSMVEPELKDMDDGEIRYYFDGSDYYMYKRVGSKLIVRDRSKAGLLS